METKYDYINQCWVVDGVIQRCGHPDEIDCGCYGKAHAGEREHGAELSTLTTGSAASDTDALKGIDKAAASALVLALNQGISEHRYEIRGGKIQIIPSEKSRGK